MTRFCQPHTFGIYHQTWMWELLCVCFTTLHLSYSHFLSIGTCIVCNIVAVCLRLVTDVSGSYLRETDINNLHIKFNFVSRIKSATRLTSTPRFISEKATQVMRKACFSEQCGTMFHNPSTLTLEPLEDTLSLSAVIILALRFSSSV